MKSKKLLSGLFYKLKKDSEHLSTKNLCGIKLEVLPGTIREKPDQDDRWFFELAKHHNTIYDIGANIGYTALLALIQNPDRYYILVDPNPKALIRASTNLIFNNIGFNAQYYCAFVNDTCDEVVNFYTIGSGQAGSMYPEHAESASAIGSYTKVNSITLDKLYSFYRLAPDLVKIDVEGAETQVLKGANQLAKETQCAFFVEMHALTHLPMEAAGTLVLDWAKEHRYNVWYLKEDVKMESASLIKDRGKCHLLLLPETKAYPEYLKGIEQSAPLPNQL